MLLRRRLVLVCALFTLASCAPARPASPAPRAMRLVSLAPNLTDAVVALGAGDRLVGISTYCQAPRPNIARVGGYLDPDVETIVALHPGLVLTPPNPSFEKAMSAFDVPVRIFQAQWSTLQDIRQSLVKVAEALALEEAGRTLVQRIDHELAEVRALAAAKPVRRVLFVIERQPGSMIVVGPGTHLSELIEVSGGRNVVPAGHPYPNMNIEAVVQLAPEVIIDVSMRGTELTDEQAAAARAVWAPYPSIPAVTRQAIRIANPDDLVQPGPDVGRSARLLYALIHETP